MQSNCPAAIFATGQFYFLYMKLRSENYLQYKKRKKTPPGIAIFLFFILYALYHTSLTFTRPPRHARSTDTAKSDMPA